VSSEPEYYDISKFSDEPLRHREDVEEALADMYDKLKEASGIERLRLSNRIDHVEQQLAFHGANPKEIPIDELRQHLHEVPGVGALEEKYRKRINNRTTGIRAYCITCMGDDMAAVRECASVTCPLHPFRMGKDPFRGYDLPKAVQPVIEDEYVEEDLEDDDD
jgi:hypothetical protein